MKVHLIAGIFFGAILASSAAQAVSTDKTKSDSERAKAYLAAVEVIQEQYASYGLDVTREALISLTAYYYPEFAARQNRVTQKSTGKAPLTGGN